MDGSSTRVRRTTFLYINMLILDERAERDVKGEIASSRIDDRVTIGEGTKVANSTIRGPTVIGKGKNCLIQGSFIGSYTSIGNGPREQAT